MGPLIGIAHHTSIARGTYSSEWGTPPEIVEVVRTAFGCIDYDLASSEEHNRIVKAGIYFTKKDPLKNVNNLAPGMIYCNPPGPSELVLHFWVQWQVCVSLCGWQGAFLLFNIDHWRMLPRPTFHTKALLLRRRLRFVGAKHQANFSSMLFFAGAKAPTGWGHVVDF